MAGGCLVTSTVRERRLAGPTPSHVHGTWNGYSNYGCRCEKCLEACRAKYEYGMAWRKANLSSIRQKSGNPAESRVGMTERMPLAREALKYKMFADDVVLFDIQVARDVIAEDLGIDFSTVGPVRLPYPKLFMEYHEPMLGDGSNPDLPFKIGFLITDSDDHRLITMEPFYLYPGEGPLRANMFLEYALNEEGLLVYQTKEFDSSRHEAFVDNGKGSTEVTVTWDDRCKFGIETIREFTPVICAMARVSLVALGLINCRNVKTEELGRFSVRRSGTDKRRGVPPKDVRYSTILLPGGGSERTGSGSGTHHRASAVHRVRGHFKTYTTDAPLMGKHVGTYWWGWQIRGSIESGVVESDYKLGA